MYQVEALPRLSCLWEAVGSGPGPALSQCIFSSTFSLSLSVLVCTLGTGMAPTSQTRGRRAQSRASVAAVRIITIATVSGCRENRESGLWTSPPTPLAASPFVCD